MTIMYNVLAQLRGLNATTMDVDELVALLSTAQGIRETYQLSGLVVPEWLADAIAALVKEVADRRTDELLRERKLLKADRRRYMTREDRLAEIAKREAEIDELLGVATKSGAAVGAGKVE